MKKTEKSKLNVIAGEYLKKHHKHKEETETPAQEKAESKETQLAEKLAGKEKHKKSK